MSKKNIGIQMTGKALLFINGVAPKTLPNIDDYTLIACSDGAFHYLETLNFPLDRLDFISGDFDSYSGENALYKDKFIHTPDQYKTDFEKSLEIIKEKGFVDVDIYGASGGEMDHFLGNLSVAYKFRSDLILNFYDEFSTFYFAPKNIVLKDVRGKIISLYPFPKAEGVTTKGLNWSLSHENLEMTSRIGTRNFATDNVVEISYESGDLILFIGNSK